MNKTTESSLKIIGAMVIGYGIGSLINKHVLKKVNKPLETVPEAEKSNASGRNFVTSPPRGAGHYCLQNGGESGYFDTSPCAKGFTELTID